MDLLYRTATLILYHYAIMSSYHKIVQYYPTLQKTLVLHFNLKLSYLIDINAGDVSSWMSGSMQMNSQVNRETYLVVLLLRLGTVYNYSA